MPGGLIDGDPAKVHLVDDNDTSEYWKNVKAAQREKREKNRTDSAGLLHQAGIRFESRNLGAHLIVHGLGLVVDFWPGTGLWIPRGHPQRKSRGVRALIDALTPTDDLK